MKFKSQSLAYPYYLTGFVMLFIQIIYGFVLVVARIGFDPFHEILPFNIIRSVHTTFLIGWLTCGMYGSIYFILPDDLKSEIYSHKIAMIQLIFLITGIVGSVICYHFQYWTGIKFLEMPSPFSYCFLGSIILFSYNVFRTGYQIPKRTFFFKIIFFVSLTFSLIQAFTQFTFNNFHIENLFRILYVHFLFEVLWMLWLLAVITYLLFNITGIDKEYSEKWFRYLSYLILGSGLFSIGHHLYFNGAPEYWRWIGGIFSAIQPMALVGISLFSILAYKKSGKQYPNKIAIYWTLGCSIMSFVGAGFLGFSHSIPGVNQFTHGTMITGMHSHFAFWGSYAMLVFAVIFYSMPYLTSKKLWNYLPGYIGFWMSNIGIVSMSAAMALAGLVQVYLEKRLGLEFFSVQREIRIHFIGMLLAGILFLAGIILIFIHFLKFGKPEKEELIAEEYKN